MFSPDDLILHGDVSYGVDQQFENEARMALRLANFLSAFLQVFIPASPRLPPPPPASSSSSPLSIDLAKD